MINVTVTAQQIQDLFYQQIMSKEDFFDLDFFINEVLSVRNALLEQEFKEERKMDISLYGDEYPLTLIGGEWSEQYKGEVKYNEDLLEYYTDIPVKIFSFPYDRYTLGVQSIIPLGKCDELLRIRLNEAWVACGFDVTADTVCWYVQHNKIVFKNIDNHCIKNIVMNLIPSYDDCTRDEKCTALVPDGKEFQIKQLVLDNTFKAYQIRLGKIDMTSNSNPNPNGSPEGAPKNSLVT